LILKICGSGSCDACGLFALANGVEGIAGLGMNGAFASELLPPANDEVAIRWINLDEACLPLRFFARDQRGSAAAETIENQVATMRTIANGIRHESDRA